MRTTLTIDDDVLDWARMLSQKLHTPFRRVVNKALRVGLATVELPTKSRHYRTKPHKMSLRIEKNLDNIQGLLTQSEGADFR
jgi:hypothetical protein